MKNKQNNGFIKNPFLYILIIVVVITGFQYFSAGSSVSRSQQINYTELVKEIRNGNVKDISYQPNGSVIEVAGTYKKEKKVKDNSGIQFFTPSSTSVSRFTSVILPSDLTVAELQKLASDKGTEITIKRESSSGVWIQVLTTLVPFAIFAFFLFSMMNQGGGGGARGAMSFGRNKARATNKEDIKVRFSDVAGAEEEKQELVEVVEFLKDPKRYTKLGARIPAGVLLEGPPGTGKTLLAKAVAGEAGVPFFSISGSDFVEMFVGVGASRVRDLFAEAKKNAPCIIFIDEIDAVARRRGTGMGGGHDEREQTLNQMLVEMDGFGVNEGIIVMAATNRVDILDPAILRPGRFDRKVLVGRPDVKGRKEILEVHAKNKPIGDDVDLEQIARITSGFTGADLENLLNEASILAAKAGKHFLTQAEINQAMIKVGIGKEKKSRIISEKEKRITAYHESGHAILFHVLPDVGPVHTVSVIPTGAGAAGYTMPLPGKDEMFLTKGKMLQEIMVDLGGRIAEELILDDITTGASQDIKQATATAKSMVTKYGFSDKLGLINYDDESDDVFIGRDLAHSKGYGENTASVIDEEVREIVDTCYKKAKKIIEDHMEQLHASAALLMEKEKIGREEFESLFDADNNQADSLTNEETV